MNEFAIPVGIMPIKTLLSTADANMLKLRVGSFVRSFREAPLSLTSLAAMSGDDPDIEYRLVDESVDRVDLDYPADLVGIRVITGTARRCYALADHFRSRGIPSNTTSSNQDVSRFGRNRE